MEDKGEADALLREPQGHGDGVGARGRVSIFSIYELAGTTQHSR